jgi:hypothetical protein
MSCIFKVSSQSDLNGAHTHGDRVRKKVDENDEARGKAEKGAWLREKEKTNSGRKRKGRAVSPVASAERNNHIRPPCVTEQEPDMSASTKTELGLRARQSNAPW